MGINYSFYLALGWEISEAKLDKAFLKQIKHKNEGKFHYEDRFDPKTGAKLEKQEKVWDESPETIVECWFEIDGKKYDDVESYQFYEGILPDLLGKGVMVIHSMNSSYYISVSTNEKNDDFGKVSTYGSLDLSDLQGKIEDAMGLKKTVRILWH